MDMKRYTALLTAILFVLVLAGGGVVSLFNTARAAIDPAIEIPYNQPGLKMFNCSASNFDEIYITKRDLSYDADVVAYYADGKYGFVACSATSNGLADYRLYLSSSGNQFTYSGFYLNSTYAYGGTTYYYHSQQFTSDYSITQAVIPLYNSFDDAILACIDGLNYTPPPPTYTYTFNIPAGYAVYIQYNADAEINMYCQMPELSRAWVSGPKPDFWESSYTYYSFATSVPNLNSTFDYSNFTRVLWDRGSDRDAFGQTQSAIFSSQLEYYYNVPFFVIYNYTYYDNEYLSPTITVTFDKAIAVYLVEINSNTVAKISDVSTDGVVTNPESGNIENPTPGGGNYIPEDSNLEVTLSGLINDIDSFFRGTWQYVRQLVQSISTFPQMITELYSWLPTEYRVVLFSAFSIVVVVGVLKVML